MQRKLEEEIDGFQIVVKQIGPMKGLRTLARLGKLVAPALDHADALSAGGLAGMELGSVGKMFGALLANLDEHEVESLARVLLEGARVKRDGKSIDLLSVHEEVFMGKTFAFLKVIVFAFKANFGDFSDALRDLAAQAKAEKASSSDSLPS